MKRLTKLEREAVSVKRMLLKKRQMLDERLALVGDAQKNIRALEERLKSLPHV